jgi:mono/diheme cytochrome c family protein
MSRLLSLTIAAVLVVPAGLHAGVTAQPDPGAKPREEGRALYAEHCASCHGASGRGDGPAAGSLRTRPTDLTRYAQTNGGVFPSEQTRRVIDGRGVGAHGSFEMPVWGSVFKTGGASGEAATRQRIDAIVVYLESLQQRSGD